MMFGKVSDVIMVVFMALLGCWAVIGLVALVASMGTILDGYMVYIYLGVAFVLAGGGWFLGYLFGKRVGRLDGRRDGFRFGVEWAAYAPTLSDQLHDHLEIMDRDE